VNNPGLGGTALGPSRVCLDKFSSAVGRNPKSFRFVWKNWG